MLGKAEHSGFGIPGLCQRGNRAQFDKSKAKKGESIKGLNILIQSRRNTYGIGKRQSHGANRLGWKAATPEIGKILINRMDPSSEADPRNHQPVCRFWIQPKE